VGGGRGGIPDKCDAAVAAAWSGKEWWTAMTFPVGSRTTVQRSTWICLTSVFGMRTGEPDRYGRPTTSVRADCAYCGRMNQIHPLQSASSACIRSLLEAENRSRSKSIRHTVMSVWTVRKGGLNTSLPRCVHPPPIKLVFYERPRRLVSTRVSRLDAFSVYPLQRGCPAVPCRTTGKLVAARPCSSRTRGPFVSGDNDPRS
jgi:hypothetical protein